MQKKEESNISYGEGTFHASMILVISLLLNFILIVTKYIIDDNVTSQYRPILSFILLVSFIVVWVLLVGLYSKGFDYFVDLIVTSLFIIFVYFIFNNKIAVIRLSCGLALILVFLFGSHFLRKTNIRRKKWLTFTILCMLLIFFIGLVSINELYGFKPTSAYLNLKGDQASRYNDSGNVTCNVDNIEREYVGSKLRCHVSPELENLTSIEIKLTSNIGETRKLNSTIDNDTFIFEAPEKISLIFFQIYGYKNNEQINLSTSWQHTFYRFEEMKERNEKFLTYLFLLLGIIFFSVPRMILDFRELIQERKQKD